MIGVYFVTLEEWKKARCVGSFVITINNSNDQAALFFELPNKIYTTYDFRSAPLSACARVFRFQPGANSKSLSQERTIRRPKAV